MKNSVSGQRQLLCGGCRKPLVRGTSCHLVDLVGEAYTERVGLQCGNPLCGYETRVIEEIHEDRASWWTRVVRYFRVEKKAWPETITHKARTEAGDVS